ncbi:unnamed protein product (macronuclear) [Paramecium tetraurelia]|uniref:Abscisic acid G-protein coupled receptor-like domain-containing protein n=1 Tax=Paramecium tetraurelia TaxID=5888 RepID=A0BKB9_PARTE|nr:uncharacterized protein GSPATT00029617001 [Paramecium tetraurelia]CAK58986.1 unnamed protein product [Paramecium tetraurelia]|eukprot:XP_001426384.1 hypothetical protein (macronuclear) [Paramecium tetraurelia strain d4-2]
MILGYWLLTSFIVPDYDIHSKFTIFLFCLTFSLSTMALGMFIFEIFKIGQSQTRPKLWSFTLFSDVLLLLYILPSLSLIFIFHSIQSIPKGIAGFLSIILIILYLVQKFHPTNIDFKLASQIDFITNIGTYMIGILSGFGAVYCPWAYFQMIINKVKQGKKAIVSNIYFILAEIEKSVVKLVLINEQYRHKLIGEEKPTFFWARITSWFKKTPTESQQRKDLKEELRQLKAIHSQLYDHFKDYIDEETRYYQSKSFYGKFLKRLAWIVLIYCIYKMIMSTINAIWGRKKSIDPISRILKVILPFFGFELDQITYETLAMYGTFIFMGYLMFSNVRSFSLNLVNIFNTFMGMAVLQKLPYEIMVLFIAEVFGVYLLSTVILLQTSLPDSFISNLKEYSQGIEILSHYEKIDKLFLLSGFISTLIIYANYHRRKSKLENFEKSDLKLRD